MEQENPLPETSLQRDSQQPFQSPSSQNPSHSQTTDMMTEQSDSEDPFLTNLSQLLRACQFQKVLHLVKAEFDSKEATLGKWNPKIVLLNNLAAEAQLGRAEYYRVAYLTMHSLKILNVLEDEPEYPSLMAHTCQCMALACREDQEHEKGLDFIHRSLELSPPDSLQNVEKYRIKALLLYDLRQYKEALEEIQKSLDLVDQPTNAIDDIIRARVYNTWGEIYSNHSILHDWKKACKAYLLAIETCTKKTDLAFHIELAKACQGAALCLMETEKSSPTVQSFVETALMICDKSFGEDYHPLRVSGFLLLARYFKQQNDMEKMCEYIDLALTAGEVLYGDCEKTREVRLSAAKVAGIRLLREQLVSPIMKASVEGKDGQELVNLYLQKSDACLLCGDYKALDALIPQALTAICNISGEMSLGMVKISERMIAFYEVTKQLKKRVGCLGLIVEIYQGLFGDSHIEIAKAYLALSGVYLAQNMFSEAILYLEQASKIQVEFYGEANSAVIETYFRLGNAYSSDMDLPKAMKTRLKVLKILEKSGDEKVSKTYESMGMLSAMMNDAESSGDCFRKSYQVARTKFGRDHERTLHPKELCRLHAQEKDMLENTQKIFE